MNKCKGFLEEKNGFRIKKNILKNEPVKKN
jgi:hypothetical protein